MARSAPDRIAVSDGDRSLTYRELAARAAAVAAELAAAGVRRGDLVGLSAPRGADLVVGLLGILETGAGYVPVDPGYPAARVEFLLHDTGVRAVVATSGTNVRAERLVLADRVTPAAAADPSASSATREPPRPDDTAYVIHTSGSTGTPKGVRVTHHNVLRLFDATAPWFAFGTGDTWTLFHSVAFDFSVWEIWGALLHGGRLVVVPQDAVRVPARFLDLVRDEGVTVLNQTPSAFRQLLAALDGAGGPDVRARGLALRLVVLGGERVDPALLGPWFAANGDEAPELVNMYGLTEATVHATYRRLRAGDLDRPGASPIGVPLPDLSVELVDPDGKPVPDGEPGEMRIGGPGVVGGYLDRPELTAARFVPGPDGRPAYLSGDLAVRTPQGELDYLGRLDDQVKVRGFRIEPGEVEACLAAEPGVAQVVVAARDHGEGDVRLDAFVVAAGPGANGNGSDPTAALPDRLERWAGERLPAHLRPAAYHLVDDVPLTPQGKADRRALLAALDAPAPATAGANGASSGNGSSGGNGSPGDAVLGAVVGIVEAVLDRPGVHPDADLFDLGATSLAVVRVVAGVNERFGLRLTGAELADGMTAAALAGCVEAAGAGAIPERTGA